jgi:AcrR family transcriptional regulator
MFQNATEGRRSRGRPQVRSDDETRRVLIEAAAHEIQTSGYAGTSMGTVAARAGVSTKTLYRLIPTKANLFELVVRDRTGHFMLAFDDVGLDGLEIGRALEQILVAYGTLTLGDETVAINRLVIGESDRFPEIAQTFYENAILRTTVALTAWLARQQALGRLRLADPELAAGMLRGMMVMEPQRAAMLGQRAVPDAAEIAARAKACAALFLDGARA